MKNVYAVWEGERTRDYITPGKKYEVFFGGNCNFSIISDNCVRLDCMWEECAPHLTEQSVAVDAF